MNDRISFFCVDGSLQQDHSLGGEQWAGCQLHLISLLGPLVRVQSAQVSIVSIVALRKEREYLSAYAVVSFQDREVAETVVGNKSLGFGSIPKCWSPFCGFLVHS